MNAYMILKLYIYMHSYNINIKKKENNYENYTEIIKKIKGM